MKMKTLLSVVAGNVAPYEWEDSLMKNSLRFDSNTMPFPPPSVGRFLSDMKATCRINEYVDPSYVGLRKLLSDYEKVPESFITVTNSGDEAIDILAKAFLNPDDYFVTTPPTYEMFSIQCSINKGKNKEVPLLSSFQVNKTKLIRESENPRTKLMFLVNPNNPTGSTIPLEIIEQIAAQSDCIVVVDQAYGEFYGKTAVPFVQKYNNLVILKSLSKFAGLAGVRIGYLIANPALSSVFNAIRFPMGVSYLSCKLAEAVLTNDRKWMGDQIRMIKNERQSLTQALRNLGLFVYPSEANFLLVKLRRNAKTICEKLKQKGILVRDRSSKPYLSGCVRVTVRSREENNQLIETLRSIL